MNDRKIFLFFIFFLYIKIVYAYDFVNNTITERCRECEIGFEYLVSLCNSTHDTKCTNCSTCRDGEYERSECNGSHDTICKQCPMCIVGLSYLTKECGPESDVFAEIECQNCTKCTIMEIKACDLTHDSVCGLTIVLSLIFTSQTSPLEFTDEIVSTISKTLISALNLPEDAIIEPKIEYATNNDRNQRSMKTKENKVKQNEYEKLHILKIDFYITIPIEENDKNQTNLENLELKKIQDKMDEVKWSLLSYNVSGLPLMNQILGIKLSSSNSNSSMTNNVSKPLFIEITSIMTTNTTNTVSEKNTNKLFDIIKKNESNISHNDHKNESAKKEKQIKSTTDSKMLFIFLGPLIGIVVLSCLQKMNKKGSRPSMIKQKKKRNKHKEKYTWFLSTFFINLSKNLCAPLSMCCIKQKKSINENVNHLPSTMMNSTLSAPNERPVDDCPTYYYC